MQIITEMAYPSAFSFKELNDLRTYAAKKRYLESHLEKIGSGSSRIVYAVDDEKVIKLAKNRKGLAQNEVEADKNTYYPAAPIDIFARVYDYDDGYYWIEMEVARKAKKSDIKSLYGVSFELITDFIRKIYSIRGNDVYKYRHISPNTRNFDRFYDDYISAGDGEDTLWFEISEKLYNFLNEIDEYIGMHTCNWTDVSDWMRLANWGIVTRNGEEHLVIVDNGLNDEIYKTHYSR